MRCGQPALTGSFPLATLHSWDVLLLHDGELVTLVVALEQMKAGFASRMNGERAREIQNLDTLIARLRGDGLSGLHDADGTPRM
jgi:hypothetical protein